VAVSVGPLAVVSSHAETSATSVTAQVSGAATPRATPSTPSAPSAASDGASGAGVVGAVGSTGSVAAEAERTRIREKFRASLLASPARQTLDSVMTSAHTPSGLFAATLIPPAVTGAPRAGVLNKSLSVQANALALEAAITSRDAEIQTLRSQLALAESERLPVGLTFVLMALLAASLGGMAYLWRGRRGVLSSSAAAAAASSTAFVDSHPAAPGDAARPVAFRAPAARRALMGRRGSAATPPHAPAQIPAPIPASSAAPGNETRASASPEGDSLVEMGEQEFDRLMASGRAYSAFRKESLQPARTAADTVAETVKSKGAALRLVDAGALAELRQQADFLVSLGQTEQALQILENHILENGESSPAVYLDLLDILHAKGQKTQFRKFREEFNLLFSGKVPEFADYLEPGKDLEDYPHVLAHIMALWPRSKVLLVIEAAIFRDPWDEHRPQLGLAAFRDLILLHAMARANAEPEKSGVGSPLVLDLDLTQPDAKTEHTDAMPSWHVDFQNTEPGSVALATPPGLTAVPVSPIQDPPSQQLQQLQQLQRAQRASGNMIDFELPIDEIPMAVKQPPAD
jgi:pilus assembly protein FimV